MEQDILVAGVQGQPPLIKVYSSKIVLCPGIDRHYLFQGSSLWERRQGGFHVAIGTKEFWTLTP